MTDHLDPYEINADTDDVISTPSVVDLLAVVWAALEHAPRTCLYHDQDFFAAGDWRGLPRCESCRQPYLTKRAYDAVADWRNQQ